MEWSFNAVVYIIVYICTLFVTIVNGYSIVRSERLSRRLQSISTDLRQSSNFLAIIEGSIGARRQRFVARPEGGTVEAPDVSAGV
ncbi:hypothetical protein [Tomato associated geminivirus 2]|nr:hypothetical protein [Tomato associated geminivirus 2]QFR15874.1 hypothetical protein [Tomato associated geminivirus 2]